MPSSSTLSANDRNIIKSVIPSSTTRKILTTSLARIYFAYPDPHSWSYGGLQGALLLVADSGLGAYFLCLVDLVGSRGKLWEHEIYRDFGYNQDRVFFHTFAGDECMVGLDFPAENDARNFYKRVVDRKGIKTKAKADSGASKEKSMAKGGIDKSLISGVDPSWIALLSDLKAHGVDEAVITENMDFIKSVVRGAQESEPVGAANGRTKELGEETTATTSM